jgi:uncharacterized membrane protein
MIFLHPPLSGMPLAFVGLLVVVEVLRCFGSWRGSLLTTQRILLISLIGSTICAFLSGYQASSPLGDLSSDVQNALGQHHAYGRLLLINSLLMGTFSLIAARAVHGKKGISALYVVTLVFQLLLTLWVGFLGGSLVFDRGVGVTLP